MSTVTESASPLCRTVQGQWRGGWRCDVTAGDFAITVDEPTSLGGTNQGPQPTDLLLAAVASCFTLSIAYVARRRSIPLHSVFVEVTGVYDGPRFRAIAVKGLLGCDEAHVDALLRGAERVCYVTNTLCSDVAVALSAKAAPQP